MLNRKDFMYLEKTPAFPTGKQLFVTAVKQHLWCLPKRSSHEYQVYNIVTDMNVKLEVIPYDLFITFLAL